MLVGVTYEGATEKTLIITTKYRKGKTIKADNIVLAVGVVSEQSLYQEVKGIVAEIYLMEDSVLPRKLRDAIAEGF